ncbi:putative ribonuclease H protein [Hibiscus syriacus]|uniref:Ribonuclease H protein n=1 Tax=Hibiscus syriacus TaxID=106335 RepID=A0A6A3A5Y8_HIBSY|nr:putative ribonuclease H protein [Hibiscus syriacus]
MAMNMPSPRLHRPKTFKQDNNLCYSPKLCLYILALCITLLLLLQFQSLQQWQNLVFKYRALASPQNCTTTTAQDPESISQKLRDSVTFLPLKDLRFANQPLDGHTWFMSSMYDTREEGEVQYQQFPSESSKGRLLCLKGRDNHDGSWNYYALAWPEALPSNATLMKGLTFVAYNHYNFDNIWHGLSAVMPFVAWHRKNNCETPSRWVLYHWGELRFKMGTWLNILMEATFGQPPYIEGFTDIEDDSQPVCFEKAVARVYCNVSVQRRVNQEGPDIGMTLLMRTGPRSFRNETAVIRIFEKECNKVKGCRLMVAYSNNLTVCEQVKLMSLTDILMSPHGAQLTNMFLMDRNSSVMELYPKGWLKLAGVGQYVYHWIASWSGMRHRGDWRDPDGEHCPYSDDDRRCMSFYKNGLIGYNETHFADWARNVLNDVETKKSEEEASKHGSASCYCS